MPKATSQPSHHAGRVFFDERRPVLERDPSLKNAKIDQTSSQRVCTLPGIYNWEQVNQSPWTARELLTGRRLVTMHFVDREGFYVQGALDKDYAPEGTLSLSCVRDPTTGDLSITWADLQYLIAFLCNDPDLCKDAPKRDALRRNIHSQSHGWSITPVSTDSEFMRLLRAMKGPPATQTRGSTFVFSWNDVPAAITSYLETRYVAIHPSVTSYPTPHVSPSAVAQSTAASRPRYMPDIAQIAPSHPVVSIPLTPPTTPLPYRSHSTQSMGHHPRLSTRLSVTPNHPVVTAALSYDIPTSTSVSQFARPAFPTPPATPFMPHGHHVHPMPHPMSPPDFAEIAIYRPVTPMGSPGSSCPSAYPTDYAPLARTNKAELYTMTRPATELASSFPGTSSPPIPTTSSSVVHPQSTRNPTPVRSAEPIFIHSQRDILIATSQLHPSIPHFATVVHPIHPTYATSVRTGSLNSNYSLASRSTAFTASPNSTPRSFEESTPFEWDFWLKDPEEVEAIEHDAVLEPIEAVASPFHSSPSEQLSWAATLAQAEYVLEDVAHHFAQALGPAPHSNIIADSAVAEEFFKGILCLGISPSPSSFY